MVLFVAVGGREATEHVRKTKASKIDSRSSTIASSGAWLLESLLACVCSSTRQPVSLLKFSLYIWRLQLPLGSV